MKKSKRVLNNFEQFERTRFYELKEAVSVTKKLANAKFDETIEIAMRLGVDPRHADQIVRGTVVLPNGTGKKVRVLVLAQGDKITEAKEAGADFAGLDDFVEKIQEGWMDIDTIIATPDVMGKVGKLGKLLGPRGLMPNPKSGTVTFDVAKAIKDVKAGKIEYRVDKVGNIHVPIGKASFTEEQLVENIESLFDAIIRAKPASAKGQYVKSATVTSTMGPGIKLDPNAIGSSKVVAK